MGQALCGGHWSPGQAALDGTGSLCERPWLLLRDGVCFKVEARIPSSIWKTPDGRLPMPGSVPWHLPPDWERAKLRIAGLISPPRGRSQYLLSMQKVFPKSRFLSCSAREEPRGPFPTSRPLLAEDAGFSLKHMSTSQWGRVSLLALDSRGRTLADSHTEMKSLKATLTNLTMGIPRRGLWAHRLLTAQPALSTD